MCILSEIRHFIVNFWSKIGFQFCVDTDVYLRCLLKHSYMFVFVRLSQDICELNTRIRTFCKIKKIK